MEECWSMVAIVSLRNSCGLNLVWQRRKEGASIISGIFRRDSIQPYRFPLYCYTPASFPILGVILNYYSLYASSAPSMYCDDPVVISTLCRACGVLRMAPRKAAFGNWVINWEIDMHPRVVKRDALRAAPPRYAIAINVSDYTIGPGY